MTSTTTMAYDILSGPCINFVFSRCVLCKLHRKFLIDIKLGGMYHSMYVEKLYPFWQEKQCHDPNTLQLIKLFVVIVEISKNHRDSP